VGRFTPHLLSLLLLLYFWATGLTNLDRFPKIHEDESWQAAPGYTFWAEGHFGTDLFAGFYGMEQHYYGFMPLFPILVGGALHLFGLGLFQARLVPLALIILTLALTHRLGTKLFSPWHGTIAVAILATWRIAGPFPPLASGIPLADVARIVRYDSAVPVFGLAALLLLVTTANRQNSPFAIRHSSFIIHKFFFIGFLTGLAVLSHVYGAFWLPALVIAMVWILGWPAIKPTILVALGFVLALTPWFIFVVSGWSDFLRQNNNYADRFSLLDARFYLINLLNEVERYDPILNGAKQSLGAWLWLILCSLSLLWLLRSTFNACPREGVQRSTFVSARILVSVLITLGGLFAFLLSFKTFSYLATLWPLFALAMAAGWRRVWEAETGYRWWRPALLFFFLLAVSEGIFFQMRLQTSGHQMTPYHTFTQAIASKLPPHSRIMGLQHYWLGLAEHSAAYRSILVPIFWTNDRYVPQPTSFSQAVDAIPPDVILLDQIMLNFLAETAAPDHPLHQLGQEIWAYLHRRQVHDVGQVDDPTYGRVQIYQLK
jgi:4-amino-4-deoxy-L-arabinose transferase-like glycosyltransferase